MPDVAALLAARYPARARPVGFYPLPDSRVTPAEFADRFEPFPTPAARRGLIYVHVPFCRQRCEFCRFFVSMYGEDAVEAFVAAACTEIRVWGALRAGHTGAAPVEAVFFGGGTPSALRLDQIEALLAAMRDAFPMVRRPEITMEWYPKDGDASKLEGARELGVTRVSFGLQSFSDETLAALGAHHDGAQSEAALAAGLRTGFESVNVDLMANVPGRTVDQALEDVDRAIAMRPANISINPLEVTDGTVIALRARRESRAEDDGEKRRMVEESTARLRDAGYANQRIRNFARDGHLHRYNRACTGIDFDIVPIGPKAYGFVGGWAVSNALTVPAWLDAIESTPGSTAVVGAARPTADEMARSFMISSLLELQVDTARFSAQFGRDVLQVFPALQGLVDAGAFVRKGDLLELADAATPHADDISLELYSETQSQLFSGHLGAAQRKGRSQYFPVT